MNLGDIMDYVNNVSNDMNPGDIMEYVSNDMNLGDIMGSLSNDMTYLCPEPVSV